MSTKHFCDCCNAEVVSSRLKTFEAKPRGNAATSVVADLCPSCFSLIVSLTKQVCFSHKMLMDASKQVAVGTLDRTITPS